MTDGERMLWTAAYVAQMRGPGTLATAAWDAWHAVGRARAMAQSGEDPGTGKPLPPEHLAMLREAIGWVDVPAGPADVPGLYREIAWLREGRDDATEERDLCRAREAQAVRDLRDALDRIEGLTRDLEKARAVPTDSAPFCNVTPDGLVRVPERVRQRLDVVAGGPVTFLVPETGPVVMLSGAEFDALLGEDDGGAS